MGESTGASAYERAPRRGAASASRRPRTSPSRSRRSSRCSTPRRSTSSIASRRCRRPREGTALEPNLVGELIASEVEVKTGKQASFADVPAALAERRAELAAARRADRARARGHRDAPLVELARPAHHRHAALPAKRRDPPVRRLAQQHLRHPHPRRDPRRRPRGARRHGAPQLAAGAPRRVGELAVPRGRRHGPPLGAHAGVHALLPALRRPRRVRVVGRLR